MEETLLSIIELQHLYITSLSYIKSRKFYQATQILEEAYTSYDVIIDNIIPTSPIRNNVIELRDLIINDLKEIKSYIYEKDDIDLSQCESTLLEDFEEHQLNNVYESRTEKYETKDCYYYIKSLFDYFPSCVRYKVKID